jgi:FliA/WhiG family RNA polymerase sigma factor
MVIEMSLFDMMSISGSALSAERLRAEVTSANMANAETTHTEDGGPYVRKEVVFSTRNGSPFRTVFAGMGEFAQPAAGTVRLSQVVDDTTPAVMRYEPGSPDANAAGYVAYPAINPASEMVDLMSDAQFRIRGAILDSLRILDWSPRELRRKGRAVQEAVQTMTSTLRRTPTDVEIARELNLEINEYQLLLGQLKGLEIGSLNLEHNDDSGEDQLAYIAGSPEDDPLFRCLQGEMRQLLIDAIEELPEKERMVLTLYYYEELTMKEIGLTLGVVESRVSQIHSSAVGRLRASLHGMQRVPKPAATRRMPVARADC